MGKGLEHGPELPPSSASGTVLGFPTHVGAAIWTTSNSSPEIQGQVKTSGPPLLYPRAPRCALMGVPSAFPSEGGVTTGTLTLKMNYRHWGRHPKTSNPDVLDVGHATREVCKTKWGRLSAILSGPKARGEMPPMPLNFLRWLVVLPLNVK